MSLERSPSSNKKRCGILMNTHSHGLQRSTEIQTLSQQITNFHSQVMVLLNTLPEQLTALLREAVALHVLGYG